MERIELLAGKCLYNNATRERHRILYVDLTEDIIYTIEMDQSIAYPEALSVESLLNADMEVWEEEDPVMDVAYATEKQKTELELRWDLIKDFVLNEPECYQKKVRSTFAAQTAKQEGCTVYRINQILYRYWRGGKRKAALIPDTSLRGGKGKTKSGSVGRKPKYDVDRPRYIITEKDIRNIQEAVDKTYNRNQKYSFAAGYSELLKKYKKDDDKTLLEAYPTKSQFTYQARQMVDVKKRFGTRKYAKDIQGHLGSSKNEARGPGDKYQVDATIADIYLVSASDRKKIIGRPTVYSVVDVFSRTIVGIYVGLENASWKAARKALFNAFRDKVDYCKYFGINIQENEWPCKGVPHAILADNGEFNSFQSDHLVTGLGINLENTAPWRADQKGIVEQSFHQLNLLTKGDAPGSVIHPSHMRGDEDYKKGARLTLYEYTQVLIHSVLLYNAIPLDRQPIQDQDYIEEGILPVPNDIWQWGMENRTGGLTVKAERELWLAMLPKVQAIVTRKGIKYKNLYFSCNTAGEERWFDNIGGRVSEKCDLIIDPDNMESAYVVLPSGKLERAVRTENSLEEYRYWTEADLDLHIHSEREKRSKRTRVTDQQKQDYRDAISQIIAEANAKYDAQKSKITGKKQSGAQIRKNREEERARIVEFPKEEMKSDYSRMTAQKWNLSADSKQTGKRRSNPINEQLKRIMEEED